MTRLSKPVSQIASDPAPLACYGLRHSLEEG